MKIRFYGSSTAELFSREVEESLRGVIKYQIITDKNDENVGFASASLDGFCWGGTMWTRDAGTLLRELALWGYMDEACLVADALMRMVDKNEDGFYTFPEHFFRSQKRAGKELDGSAAILIGLCIIYERLSGENATKSRIRDFLLSADSPVAYVFSRLDGAELLDGSGEFGGGCAVEGSHVNVVQNNLIRLALIAASRFYEREGQEELCRASLEAAAKIEKGMRAHLIDDKNCLIWCVDKDTLLPDEKILDERVNRGTGLINGVLTMSSDVFGLDVSRDNLPVYDEAVNTFYKLHNTPLRNELFQKYGTWMQFDDWTPGFTGPSYGHGYAIQAMLLMNRLDLAAKALDYLAHETYEPIYNVPRTSPYYFFERYYCPYTIEQDAYMEVGCGALNMVCVTEPAKIARMIAGFDFCADTPKIFPRLPDGFDGYEASDVEILCDGRIYLADVSCKKKDGALEISINTKGNPLPRLTLQTPSGKVELEDVKNENIILK